MVDIIAAICIIGIIIYIVRWIANKDKRAAEKERLRQERERTKQNMLSDPTILLMAENICEGITNLTNAPVKVLRTGGKFYLLFKGGSVYYETRWTEKIGDSYEKLKKTQCILDRIGMGKNPLSDYENGIFKDIVADKLNKVPWLSVGSGSYNEFEVRKAPNQTIPEAF